MSLKAPERFRALEYSSAENGNNGVFYVPGRTSRETLKVICSDGLGWAHVSVSKRYECPTWEEMCHIKSLFWDDPEDCVIQYHPPRSEYVNNCGTCLHLWQPLDGSQIPRPPTILVGVK